MVQYNPLQFLPTQEELPETDHKPVDSQLQVLIASLLDDILSWAWSHRTDWFWGINMGVYYQQHLPPIVPNGFLCLGVERLPRQGGRLSYVVWQEGSVPLLALEYVSKTYGGEYDTKKDDYANIGVTYYAVYNPEYSTCHNHSPFEVYRLVQGTYVLQSGEPFFLPEIGLGIGRASGTYRGWSREWLYWYDSDGNRLPSPDQRAEMTQQEIQQQRQRAEIAQQQLEQERRKTEQLIARLRERGIDPDTL